MLETWSAYVERCVCGEYIQNMEKTWSILIARIIGLPKPVRHGLSICSLLHMKFYPFGCSCNMRAVISWKCVLVVSLTTDISLGKLLGSSK